MPCFLGWRDCLRQWLGGSKTQRVRHLLDYLLCLGVEVAGQGPLLPSSLWAVMLSPSELYSSVPFIQIIRPRYVGFIPYTFPLKKTQNL